MTVIICRRCVYVCCLRRVMLLLLVQRAVRADVQWTSFFSIFFFVLIYVICRLATDWALIRLQMANVATRDFIYLSNIVRHRTLRCERTDRMSIDMCLTSSKNWFSVFSLGGNGNHALSLWPDRNDARTGLFLFYGTDRYVVFFIFICCAIWICEYIYKLFTVFVPAHKMASSAERC